MYILQRIFTFSMILLSSIFTTISLAQTMQNCCAMSASSTIEFAQLGKDLSFVIAHEEPLPYILENPTGTMIQFPCADGKSGQAYYIASKEKSEKYIFVIHEWWGLNDYIKREAENLALAFTDAHILALDLYDGKVATTQEEAAASMQSVTETRAENIISGASEWSGKDSRIATIGWCFGGSWSLKSTILLGDKSKACVIYYGMPVKKEEELQKITAPVLGIFAEQDGWITPKAVSEFEASMKKLNKTVEIHNYDAKHAFANPSNPIYNESASKDAWSKTLIFLKKYL